MSEQVTVYEAVGGEPFFTALVQRFYTAVAADELLRPMYPRDLSGAEDRLPKLFLDDPVGGPLLAEAVLPGCLVAHVVRQPDQFQRQVVSRAATELLVLDQIGHGASTLADPHRVVGLHSRQRQRGQQLRRLLLHPVTDPRGNSVVGDHQRCETATGIVPAQAGDAIDFLPRRAGGSAGCGAVGRGAVA